MTRRTALVSAAVVAVATIVVAALVAFAGSPDGAGGGTVTPRAVGSGGISGPGAAPAVAELARIRVPPGASDVDARFASALDEIATLRFTASRVRARAAVRAAGFTPRPRRGVSGHAAASLARVGWRQPAPRGTRGAVVEEPGLVREVAVVPRPDGRATVYVFAATTP